MAILKQRHPQAPKPLDLENSSFVAMWPDRQENER